ncbi:hypothetical protein BHQ18_09420 [Mycolicibacterium flavescens]|uniref:Uncharacterized protein n=1 Tax=Mycolicibacterium flavescens TaxID=1776 RepID=A0A1E3RM36_MYCFV|nr:hypothetical protein BHQ18_09420 [Mycolicibacterium flavescens]
MPLTLRDGVCLGTVTSTAARRGGVLVELVEYAGMTVASDQPPQLTVCEQVGSGEFDEQLVNAVV